MSAERKRLTAARILPSEQKRAVCHREERIDSLVYRWPLAVVVEGRFPALEVRWHEAGSLTTRYIEHDPLMAPE